MKSRFQTLVSFLLHSLRAPTRRARRSVAIVTLALIVGSLEGACLSPQDIEIEEPPATVHLPPTFDVTKDVTPDSPVVCLSSLEPGTEFRIDNIQDPSGQQLDARWFVDYEDGETGVQEPDPISPDPGSTVAHSAIFNIGTLEPGFLASIGHPFFVDVVISDGFADPPAEPINRAIADGKFSVTYRWTVEYLNGSPCPESP